jgi:hypothetical protein
MTGGMRVCIVAGRLYGMFAVGRITELTPPSFDVRKVPNSRSALLRLVNDAEPKLAKSKPRGLTHTKVDTTEHSK